MSSNRIIQLTLTFYLLTFGFSQLIYGPFSDCFGRRKIIVLGLSLSLLGSVICLMSVNILMLLVGRSLQGLGLGAGSSIARAVLRDIYSGDRLARTGSFISIGTAFSMTVGPAIGGYIQHYFGWRFNFLFILLYTCFGVAMVLAFLPETNKQLNEKAIRVAIFFKNYFHLLKSPIFIGYTLCASLGSGGLFAYYAASPFLFEDVIGLSAVEYGWLAIILAGGIALGGFCNALIIKKLGRHRMLVLGVILMFIAGVSMLVPALFGSLSVLAVMLPMFLYTLGAASTFANACAGALSPFAKMAGFAGALYGCFQILGGSIATAIISLAHERNQIPLSIILILVGLFAYFLQFFAFKAAVRMKFQ